MSYRVELDNRAAKHISNLAAGVQSRIIAGLESLQENPRPSGCAKLKGQSQPVWRIRVGDYRILYRIHDNESLVRVYGIFRRDEAYRD